MVQWHSAVSRLIDDRTALFFPAADHRHTHESSDKRTPTLLRHHRHSHQTGKKLAHSVAFQSKAVWLLQLFMEKVTYFRLSPSQSWASLVPLSLRRRQVSCATQRQPQIQRCCSSSGAQSGLSPEHAPERSRHVCWPSGEGTVSQASHYPVSLCDLTTVQLQKTLTIP
jgi:hypothetical protein